MSGTLKRRGGREWIRGAGKWGLSGVFSSISRLTKFNITRFANLAYTKLAGNRTKQKSSIVPIMKRKRSSWKIMEQEKIVQTAHPRKRAAAAKREFIVSETYEGPLKLTDIFSDLLCAEYRRKERRDSRTQGCDTEWILLYYLLNGRKRCIMSMIEVG